MARIVCGADGCPAGWIVVSLDLDAGTIAGGVFASARALVHQEPQPLVLALDMPIGLTEAGGRACDVEARRLLGYPRRCSVFPTPIRPALSAASREEASTITRREDGRGVGVQTWGILPKIRDVDQVLRTRPDLQSFVREVHPEVSFWAWNDEVPMVHGKKRSRGRRERLELVRRRYGIEPFEALRSRFARREVATDDLLDAFAALWTAERIHSCTAVSLPKDPPTDASGLRMEIVY